MVSPVPLISVCIPSHGRPLRLRWLLEALAEQTLTDVEVVVCHDDPPDGDTARLLAERPVRELHVAPCGPARKRNAAWRAATAPLVAFTDDDCRPAPDWLERLVAAMGDGDELRVVQGAVRPDEAEWSLYQRVASARSVWLDPPTAWGQTANICYPRALLEQLGGLDESLPYVGDDTDLLQRALGAGARLVAAPDALVGHMVETTGLRDHLRTLGRWRGVPAVVARHPHLRAPMPLRVFWKTRHATFALGAGGLAVAAARRRAWPLVLLAPWVREALPSYGRRPRGLLRAASELPGRAVVDAVEVFQVARGAAESRTFLL